jgi:hypothetical protein
VVFVFFSHCSLVQVSRIVPSPQSWKQPDTSVVEVVEVVVEVLVDVVVSGGHSALTPSQ